MLRTANDRECSGELRFRVDDRHSQGPFSFAFGESGYSWVDIPATTVAASDSAQQKDSSAGAGAVPMTNGHFNLPEICSSRASHNHFYD